MELIEPTITHQQIMEGDTFELEMGNKPGYIWFK